MPPVPAEIDLFSIPHSRMKELVNTYSHKVQCVDYRDCQETCLLLKELQTILCEFKSHEWIENMFIMEQLKNRLKQRHIYNYAVCNCHNDNRLAKMLNLVRNGKHLKESSISERMDFCEQLQRSFSEFVQQFLPHMEEEENIFQPLMVEHFEYEELRVLKDAVLEQHELIKDPLYQEKSEQDLPELNSAIKDFRDIDSDLWSLSELFTEISYNDEKTQITDEFIPNFPKSISSVDILSNSLPQEETRSVELPSEVMVQIFSYLTPPDRGRCAQVCSRWNNIVYSSPLWKEIYPIQWARGIWAWFDANLNFELEDSALQNDKNLNQKCNWKYDEDADIDEAEEEMSPLSSDASVMETQVFASIVSYLLPKIGNRVEKIVLDAGSSLSSRQIRQALLLCPNIEYLSAAYTSFDYYTLKGLQQYNCLTKLRHLDLQGSLSVDDSCLSLLAECLSPFQRKKSTCPIQIWPEDFEMSPDNCPNLGTDLSCLLIGAPCPFRVSTGRMINHCNSGEDFHINDRVRYFDYVEFEIEELYRPVKCSFVYSMEHLNLSGCHKVTDLGLGFLLRLGLLQNLIYLNVSSCYEMSGFALSDIIDHCRKLLPENLTYCNSIVNGPFPTLANGCENICHPIKVCCQANNL